MTEEEQRTAGKEWQRLEGLVAELARAKAERDALQQRIANLQEALSNSKGGLKLAKLQAQLPLVKCKVVDQDRLLRLEALCRHTATGEKAPHPAVKIKMFNTIDYDPRRALKYARSRLPDALVLDKAKFEAVAKVLEFDFVEFGQEPRVTIARDLSQYVDGIDAPED